MNYNDYELVYMIKEDEDMLPVLIKKYEPLFWKLSHSFIKSYEHKGLDIEDLIQQCRITLCYAIDKYNSSNDVLFYSYLLVCLRRGIINYARSYIKKPDCYNYMDIENYENLEVFKDDLDASSMYINYEFELHTINFKNTLDSLDAQIFELRYNNFSYKDIASLLEINKKKVDNSLLKVRKKMEKYFLFSPFML